MRCVVAEMDGVDRVVKKSEYVEAVRYSLDGMPDHFLSQRQVTLEEEKQPEDHL